MPQGTIVGLFRDRENAERGNRQLLAAGFPGGAISIVSVAAGEALAGTGIRDEEVRRFNRALLSGGVIIAVQAGARALEARAILQQNNADLGPSGEATPEPAPSAGERDRRDAARGGRRRTDLLDHPSET